MKKAINLTIGLLLIASISVLGQEVKTEKMKVSGNCKMCKERIEKAATEIDGVSKAEWDQETKMLEVAYDGSKVKTDDIQKAIAKAGHDTDKIKSTDKDYESLAGCCKYKRE